MQRRNEGYEGRRYGGQDDNFRDHEREQRYGQGYPGAERDDEQRHGRRGPESRYGSGFGRDELGRDGDNPRPYGSDYGARDRYSGDRSRGTGGAEAWEAGRAYGQGGFARQPGQGWGQGYADQGQGYGQQAGQPQRGSGAEGNYSRDYAGDYPGDYSGGSQSQTGFGGQSHRGFRGESVGPAGEQQYGRGAGSNHRFSDDYLRWRDEQIRRFDDDYSAWTSERQKEFSSEFETWRQNRPQQSGQPGGGDSWKSESATHKSASTGVYAGSDDKNKKKTD